MNKSMKSFLSANLRACALLVAVAFTPILARADLVGNYTADANTLFLLHFDEAAGGTFATNSGSKGGKFFSVTEAAASATFCIATISAATA